MMCFVHTTFVHNEAILILLLWTEYVSSFAAHNAMSSTAHRHETHCCLEQLTMTFINLEYRQFLLDKNIRLACEDVHVQSTGRSVCLLSILYYHRCCHVVQHFSYYVKWDTIRPISIYVIRYLQKDV